jgi:hypothetical protein
MDRGELQREQSLKMKRIVSQTKLKRRQRWLLYVDQPARYIIPAVNSSQPEKVSSTVTSSDHSYGSTVGRDDSIGPQDSVQSQTYELDWITFNELIWDASLYSSTASTEFLLHQENGKTTLVYSAVI